MKNKPVYMISLIFLKFVFNIDARCQMQTKYTKAKGGGGQKQKVSFCEQTHDVLFFVCLGFVYMHHHTEIELKYF